MPRRTVDEGHHLQFYARRNGTQTRDHSAKEHQFDNLGRCKSYRLVRRRRIKFQIQIERVIDLAKQSTDLQTQCLAESCQLASLPKQD